MAEFCARQFSSVCLNAICLPYQNLAIFKNHQELTPRTLEFRHMAAKATVKKRQFRMTAFTFVVSGWLLSSAGALADAGTAQFEAAYPKTWVELRDKTSAFDPAYLPPARKDGALRVLSMGDSISLCYLPYLRRELGAGFAVDRIPHNGASTSRGMESIDAYLDAGPFDAIVFNWGLHDLIHRTRGSGAEQTIAYHTPLDAYVERLDGLVTKLRDSGAMLFWVETTPVQNVERYNAADVDAYNAAARTVMERMGVTIIEPAAQYDSVAAIPFHADGIHFQAAACQAFGETVSAEIKASFQ
jgi:hypothetical protein